MSEKKKTRLLAADAAGVSEAAEILRAGGLVAFPTETVYGLGADARNVEAVRRIEKRAEAARDQAGDRTGARRSRRSALAQCEQHDRQHCGIDRDRSPGGTFEPLPVFLPYR